MRETQRNIRNYQKRLVGVKEKLATAGLLFIMSAVMLTTASFAWITLSVAPEVTGISTTITGNGNLEIALASSDENGLTKLPEASQVGDSNKNLVEKNITWGNLVNLNDSSYGLEQVVLRPATLNTLSLLSNPLYAAQYSDDGRIGVLNNGFSYSNYNADEKNFVIPNKELGEITSYGVRAISSEIKKFSSTGTSEKYGIWEEINTSYSIVKNDYLYNLVGNTNYINSISALMGTYLTDGLNDTQTDSVDDIRNFYQMMIYFNKIMDQLGEIYAKIINAQNKSSVWTWESLKQDPKDETYWKEQQGVSIIDGYNTFIDDYNGMKSAIEAVQTKLDEVDNGTRAVLYVEDILTQINFFVNIGTCLIDNEHTVNNLMGDKSTAAGIVMSGGTHEGVIQNGALQRFEQVAGIKMDVKNIKIKVKYIVQVELKANISTSATTPGVLDKVILQEYGGSLYNYLLSDVEVIKTAGDVYGLVIDFWVRTNVEESYLILEGQPEVQYSVLTNLEGCACFQDEEGIIYYYKPKNGCVIGKYDGIDPRIEKPNIEDLQDGEFYVYSTSQHRPFDEKPEDATDDQIKEAGLFLREDFLPTLSYVEKSVVVGYDGVNRIWQTDNALIDSDSSTTQGLGSCFIFYPDNPLEQKQMLKLLNALSVSFADESGTYLATASLDSENAYEEGGKITVPLKLISSSVNPNELGENNNNLVITKLEQNQPTLITAIVYLDGSYVENQDVNAATNINGALNLQFGSTELLLSMKDDELASQTISVSAGVKETGSSDEYSSVIDFGDNVTLPKSIDLNVSVSGVDPGEVKVNFVRKVNNYQGEKMEDIILSESSEGNWTGTFDLKIPGTYLLNRVWIDGIEYELKEEITVTAGSFSISNIGWNEMSNEIYVISSEKSYSVEVFAKINTSEYYRIDSARALFRNESNDYLTINLSSNSVGEWSGQGVFTTSGKYVLEYIVINNNVYVDIPEKQRKVANITLGINAIVDLARESFEWVSEETDEKNNVVKINSVSILDNKGVKLDPMDNVVIRYGLSGSDDYVDSDLTWNPATKTYKGQFNIVNAGVYTFEYIKIGAMGEVSKAVAETITAIPPYEPIAINNSLAGSEYQFAPKDDGGFTFEIKDSSTAKIAAKLQYTNPKNNSTSEFVVPASLIVNDSSTRISTWKIVPYNSELQRQDGKWELMEIYLTDVFVNENWNSASGDEWWKSDTQVVKWSPQLFTSDKNKCTINILTDIYVSVNYSYSQPNGKFAFDDKSKTVTYTSDFTDSIDGNYKLTGYSISYKDYFDRSIETLNFDIQITNSLGYVYQANSKKPEVGTGSNSGWWISRGNTVISYASLISDITNQKITFDVSNEEVKLLYPGEYTPALSITLVSDGKTYTNGLNDSNSDCFVITYSVAKAVVYWNRPVVQYQSLNQTTVEAKPKDGSKQTKTNILEPYYIEVYMKYDEGGTCSDEKWEATQVVAQLTNYGATTSAKAIAKKADGTQTFTFSFTNGTSGSTKIGTDGTSPVPIGSEQSIISEVIITYNNTDYTFVLENPLTAIGPY